ncbi:MAG TPA: circularly permuted type 2 ATP-grasp protein [Dehalococcoidia bacterium]|nr:circularly permuted type 2 ATP-grasp protein [Dehalococcoidia bacterium]
MKFSSYQTESHYDEYFKDNGIPRSAMAPFVKRIDQLSKKEILRRKSAAESALLQAGITFTIYGEQQGQIDRIFPFDIIPRIIAPDDWDVIERGLKQRIYALNQFINDIYNEKKIIKDKVIPEEIVMSAKSYRPQCTGLHPPKEIWCHITGTDIVRNSDGQLYVLEDNLRCPSGVSYVLENREVLKRTFPVIFERMSVYPVDDYPNMLYDTLNYLAPENVDSPNIVVLTPGIYNSAYFEHSFLSRQMGVQLVEGADLVVIDGFVYMRTIYGFERVDIIYRRIDDDFIDPLSFRKDSVLGIPGITEVYQSGRIAFANGLGTGIADDKAIYTYVPEIIKYYMDEDIILPNVPTYLCVDEKQRQYVIRNIKKLVVKSVNESGGYGMLIGPHSTREQRINFIEKINSNPRNYIAQPTLNLSCVPTIIDDHFEPRHVDFRPYILYGEDIWVMPGGLTRVALPKDSLVVNSSQGGGSKDTWVLQSPERKSKSVPSIIKPREVTAVENAE